MLWMRLESLSSLLDCVKKQNTSCFFEEEHGLRKRARINKSVTNYRVSETHLHPSVKEVRRHYITWPAKTSETPTNIIQHTYVCIKVYEHRLSVTTGRIERFMYWRGWGWGRAVSKQYSLSSSVLTGCAGYQTVRFCVRWWTGASFKTLRRRINIQIEGIYHVPSRKWWERDRGVSGHPSPTATL